MQQDCEFKQVKTKHHAYYQEHDKGNHTQGNMDY